MKKFILILGVAMFLTSCGIARGESTTAVSTTKTEITAENTENNTIAEEPVEALPSEVSKERAAEMLVEHIVNYVLAKKCELKAYNFDSQDLFYFLTSLCLYDENVAHPYSDMVSLSEDGNFYEISLEGGHFINLHTFRVNNWTSTDYYYRELIDTEAGCYRIPRGLGISKAPYACVDTQTHTSDGQIFVEFNLVSGYSGFEDEEYVDIGRYFFTFAEEDLVLLGFDRAERLTKDTPYIISQKENWGSVVKYEFVANDGMLVTINEVTEEYYNSEGLLYKLMQYDKNGKHVSTRFYTYENGLLVKCEEYNADGELTFEGTYVRGKLLYLEYPDYWQKCEYNEKGLIIRESFSTIAETRYTEGVTEYTYDENGWLIREDVVMNEQQSGYAHTYDEKGNRVLTQRIYDGTLVDYVIRTYYPDGTLKTEQMLSDGYVYEIHLYEYLPNGILWRSSYIYSPDIEAVGEYEEVFTYEFDDDGRIKGVAVDKYDLALGKYIKQHKAEITYSGGGRVRTDTHYHIDEDGELTFECELFLVYDEYGKLVSCDTVRGDRESLSYYFGNSENFFYNPKKYAYDEYGRVESVTKSGVVAERYQYMDCTSEQYELYQKVIANKER